jgi:hypothetical protein
MHFKGLSFTIIDQLINSSNNKSLKAAWESSLAHQLPPMLFTDYETVKSDFLILF